MPQKQDFPEGYIVFHTHPTKRGQRRWFGRIFGKTLNNLSELSVGFFHDINLHICDRLNFQAVCHFGDANCPVNF